MLAGVEVTRKTLFESDTLQIGLFGARPANDACGEVERQDRHVVVLPFSGVFAKHDRPGAHVIGTPSHAVLIAADTPYRLGFPGAIGDRALILRFDDALAPEQIAAAPASHGLLPANAMMRRNLLRASLERGVPDAFEIEAAGLDLLAMALRSMRPGSPPPRRATMARWARALERVKEAVASAPAERWTVARLAAIAHLSPFHLCHVFRRLAGTSIYAYVLHARLAQALDAVLDGADDLTAVALDAGFVSHSHFTARFRGFFGCTPAALRGAATAARASELRRIMTARRGRVALA
jgi:AraC-like DNA-binding protein